MLFIRGVKAMSGASSAWHVSQKNPLIHNQVQEVVEVQADGDELHWIRENLGVGMNISGKIPVVRFFGDEAKFIAANLTDL